MENNKRNNLENKIGLYEVFNEYENNLSRYNYSKLRLKTNLQQIYESNIIKRFNLTDSEEFKNLYQEFLFLKYNSIILDYECETENFGDW